jgi:hypothetical protein
MPARITPTPSEHTYPARAGHKRLAADRREAEAARLRAEADELDGLWNEYKSRVAS